MKNLLIPLGTLWKAYKAHGEMAFRDAALLLGYSHVEIRNFLYKESLIKNGYFSIAETKSASLQLLFKNYPDNFIEAASHYGYSPIEIKRFLKSQQPVDLIEQNDKQNDQLQEQYAS
ncbi:hypothetical protein PCC9214_02358 [Planktothrix tepida]|uniref:Uncharacterized protein n=2 Tax=Planktothrix TaxID=54304 RepID=A0A1J1LIM9_9CYAN|nr:MULTISPECIES: hypothetical protein [Planktothrix]CAD5947850.1 hypothetical protein PCC9214_02358 [Planktothrix tepida]CAD5963020.1 hypothetical protein NO713_03323 [Planktothrix pseudagardhii]CUR31874.1 hypothetical protein PL921430013 [Planktothrix tepida PCC 9214]